jgi:hypothetical protein
VSPIAICLPIRSLLHNSCGEAQLTTYWTIGTVNEVRRWILSFWYSECLSTLESEQSTNRAGNLASPVPWVSRFGVAPFPLTPPLIESSLNMLATSLLASLLESIVSNDELDLLDAIDSLRSQGVSHYVSLPQLIVCGD